MVGQLKARASREPALGTTGFAGSALALDEESRVEGGVHTVDDPLRGSASSSLGAFSCGLHRFDCAGSASSLFTSSP